ncbi:MAG: bacterioferritin [Burkholderiaceae bacterium]|nr:bacterioferritin [Burkholderiaceae bacterium]MEB2350186.1 bacterioferritin [Burkholderiaceae bacterium]
MKGDRKVIEWLNRQLRNELTAINQYFLHARIFGNWGLAGLEKFEHDESIGEMKHADALIKRILMLEGLPNLQDIGKLNIGENTEEILAADLALERSVLPTLKDGVACCESVGDYVSRELLVAILDDSEEHIDFLETQLELIGKVGLQNYQQAQMRGGPAS